MLFFFSLSLSTIEVGPIFPRMRGEETWGVNGDGETGDAGRVLLVLETVRVTSVVWRRNFLRTLRVGTWQGLALKKRVANFTLLCPVQVTRRRMAYLSPRSTLLL
jgi:hypothetical protein